MRRIIPYIRNIVSATSDKSVVDRHSELMGGFACLRTHPFEVQLEGRGAVLEHGTNYQAVPGLLGPAEMAECLGAPYLAAQTGSALRAAVARMRPEAHNLYSPSLDADHLYAPFHPRDGGLRSAARDAMVCHEADRNGHLLRMDPMSPVSSYAHIYHQGNRARMEWLYAASVRLQHNRDVKLSHKSPSFTADGLCAADQAPLRMCFVRPVQVLVPKPQSVGGAEGWQPPGGGWAVRIHDMVHATHGYGGTDAPYPQRVAESKWRILSTGGVAGMAFRLARDVPAIPVEALPHTVNPLAPLWAADMGVQAPTAFYRVAAALWEAFVASGYQPPHGLMLFVQGQLEAVRLCGRGTPRAVCSEDITTTEMQSLLAHVRDHVKEVLNATQSTWVQGIKEGAGGSISQYLYWPGLARKSPRGYARVSPTLYIGCQAAVNLEMKQTVKSHENIVGAVDWTIDIQSIAAGLCLALFADRMAEFCVRAMDNFDHAEAILEGGSTHMRIAWDYTNSVRAYDMRTEDAARLEVWAEAPDLDSAVAAEAWRSCWEVLGNTVSFTGFMNQMDPGVWVRGQSDGLQAPDWVSLPDAGSGWDKVRALRRDKEESENGEQG